MKVLILGATGYLGKKLATYLVKKGYDVVKCIRNALAEELDSYEYVKVELLEDYLKANRMDWIINCVALYEKKEFDCEKLFEANYQFGLHAFMLAKKNGVKNFLTIDTSLPGELNYYSLFKKQFAQFGKVMCKNSDMTFVNVVLELFYGEDEPEDRFLTSTCHKMLLNEEVALTKGCQKRDIIYVEDVCGAIETIIHFGPDGYMEVPVGTGEAVSVREIVEFLQKYLGSESKLNFGEIPMRDYEPDCIADVSILNKLGYAIKYPWKKGLEHFCEEIRKKRG